MPTFNLEKIKTLQEFPPIVFLYGKDAFSLDETYRKIRAFLVKDESQMVDFEVVDGEERDLSYVLMMAVQLPMLSEKRVLIVKRFDSLFKEGKRGASEKTKSALAEFNKYIESPNPSTALVLLVEEPEDARDSKTNFSAKKSPFDSLIKQHFSQEFPRVYANKFPKWVQDRFASRGVAVDFRTAELIVSQTQQKLMDISNEVDKILLYEPAAKNISFELASKIIGYTRDNTVYDLANAVLARKSKQAYSILFNILKNQGQELIIINTLRDAFVKIFKLIELKAEGNTDDAIARNISVNQYFLKDYMVALNKYSLNELNNVFVVLAGADKQMKSTNFNKKLVMQEMLDKILAI